MISVKEIGRGFFTLWTSVIVVLGGIALAINARWGISSGTLAGRIGSAAWLLALSLAGLVLFWMILRAGAAKAATIVLLLSAASGGLVLRAMAVGPLGLAASANGAVREDSRTPAQTDFTGADPGAMAKAEKSEGDATGTRDDRALAESISTTTGSSMEEGIDPRLAKAAGARSAADAALRVSSLLLSALAVGAVTVAMVLGHWYLVQPKLALAPLRRLCDVLMGILIARLLVSGWGIVSGLRAGPLFKSSDPIPWEALILSQRMLFGFGGALVLAILIRKTVALRSTMSATGLLYIAILFVWVGEFLSLYLWSSTGGRLIV